jgi:hypothetical protein
MSGAAAFYLRSLRNNVHAGARLAFFMPVRGHDYRVSAADFALLVALDLVLWFAAAVLRTGFDGQLDPAAIPLYLGTVILVLGSALAVSLIYRAPERLMLLAVALVASDPVFELVGLALPFLAAVTGIGGAIYFLFIAWVWLVSLRAVAICAGRQRPQYWWGAGAVTAVMAVAFFLFPRAEVWQAAPEPAEEGPSLADERLFFRQGELLAQALGAVQPGKPGVPELYFVGFAPDASQDVFLREMRFVKKQFDGRFRTAGRSVALASSHTALDELPIASTTNLSRALARVGEAMNADEDVLFLFLSAHGDKEHRLSASQPPLQLASLTPTALSRMLQESGIRWRVIVVSACYAGGFIEPLRDDNTLIIAASAADRASFGCENGREFTYFGQAYFRDALAKTRSFTAAFEHASEAVTRQEKEEKLTPSLPQMALGKAIAEQLKKFAE